MVVGDQERKKDLTRFKKERRGSPYRVPPGSLESALMVVKQVFGDETLGISDTSFWIKTEERVTMSPGEACFQYYLAGKGHITLAEMLLDRFPNFKSARLSGDSTPTEVGEKVGELAAALFELYPPRYRRMFSEKGTSELKAG